MIEVKVEGKAIQIEKDKVKLKPIILPYTKTDLEWSAIQKTLREEYKLTNNEVDLVHGYVEEYFEKIEDREQQLNEKFKLNKLREQFGDKLAMAEQFLEVQPLFYTTTKIWWVWDQVKKCWEQVDEIDILNNLEDEGSAEKLYNSQVKTEILTALKMKGRKNKPLEAKKTWIQFKDKIYDLKTEEVFESTSKYFMTNPLPYKIGETEETPTIDKLFCDWVDPKNVETLYEIIAYSMLSDYPMHNLFCLNGEGRNGKGTFINILSKMIGEENTCTTDLNLLVSNRFESNKLYKKLVCKMGEIDSTIFTKTNLIKKLTGGDSIGYEFKGKDGFNDYNYAKIIIATNQLPETTDKTVGFYSRWLIIDFNNTFKIKTNLIDTIPEVEFENLAKKCIRLLKELLKTGEFTNQGTYEERAARYEERATPIKIFLKQNCTEGIDKTALFWKLHEDYIDFISSRGVRKISKGAFSKQLRLKGFEIRKENYTKEDETQSSRYVVYGLELKTVIKTVVQEQIDAFNE